MISWWILSVIASLFLAMFVYYNQIAKLPSPLLMMYRGFGVAIIMLPICLMIGVKLHPLFYILSSIQGLVIGFIDNRFFRSSKDFGAEITGSIQPTALILTFILWLAIKPDTFMDLLNDPLKFLAISFCILGVVVSVILLRKTEINRTAILFLLPCIILGGFGDPFIKIILSYGTGNYIATVVMYTMISALFSGIYNVNRYIKDNGKISHLFEMKNLKHGIVIIFSLIGLVFFKGNALAISPNPAYVAAVIYLSPIWIAMFNQAYIVISGNQAENTINKKVLFLLIISIITLILITN